MENPEICVSRNNKLSLKAIICVINAPNQNENQGTDSSKYRPFDPAPDMPGTATDKAGG
ncbi:hypothetical protein [Sphingomonas bisphenolicum]